MPDETFPVAVPLDADLKKQQEIDPEDGLLLAQLLQKPTDSHGVFLRRDQIHERDTRRNPFGVIGAAPTIPGPSPTPHLRSFMGELAAAAGRSVLNIPAQMATAVGSVVIGPEGARDMAGQLPGRLLARQLAPTDAESWANTIGSLPAMLAEGPAGAGIAGFNNGVERTDGNLAAGIASGALNYAATIIPLSVGMATAPLAARIGGAAAVGGVSNAVAGGVDEQLLRGMGAAPQDVRYTRKFVEGAVMGAGFAGAHALTGRLAGKLHRARVEAFDSPPAGGPKIPADVAPDSAKPADSAPADDAGGRGTAQEVLSKEVGGAPSSVPTGDEFHAAVSRANLDHPFGAAVEVKDASFYNDPGTKLFLSAPEGADPAVRSGVAVSATGDLISVFRHPQSTAPIKPLLMEAAKVAKTLDGFDINGMLPDLYAPLGFRPVARVPFSRDYAPARWNYELMGVPDVVLMVKDSVGASGAPAVPAKENGGYASIRESVPLLRYDDATPLQTAARGNVDRAAFESSVKESSGPERAAAATALADLAHSTQAATSGGSPHDLWSLLTPDAAKQYAEHGATLAGMLKGGTPSEGLNGLTGLFVETILKHRPDLMGQIGEAEGATVGTKKFVGALARVFKESLVAGKIPEGREVETAKFRQWSKDLYATLLTGPLADSISDKTHDLFRMAGGDNGGFVDVDGTAAAISRTVNDLVSKGTPFDEAATQATVEHLNLSKFNVADNVAALIGAIERDFTAPAVAEKDGAHRSLEQTKMRAVSMLGDPVALIDWVKLNVDQVSTLDSKIVALKSVRNAVTLRLGELAAERAADMHSGPGDALEIDAIMRAVTAVSELTSRMQRGAARATNAGNVRTSDGSKIDAAVEALNTGLADLKQLGETLRATGADVPDSDLLGLLNDPARGPKVADALSNGATNPDYVPRLISFLRKEGRSSGRKVLDAYLEFRGAALLSGARTFDSNLLGNVINTVLKPMNQIVGGAASMDPKTIKSGFGMYYQMTASMFDFVNLAGTSTPSSVAMAGRAFMQNKPLIDATTEARPAAIPAWLGGGIVRLPFRGLQGVDEFFKQINYRAAIRQRVIDKVNALPDVALAKMTTEQRKQAITEAVKQAVGSEGQAALTPEGDLKFPKEMQYAREAAYQQDPGTWTQAMLNFADKVPVLRILMPFIRVPGNILGKTWDLTPGLNLLREQYGERLRSSDPYVRAEARGEMATGSAVLGTSVALAAAGLTTGGGPMDPKRRQLLIDSGWQPYSFVLPQPDGSKKYVSYIRMEPFGPLFGVPADAVNAWGYMSNEDGDRIADALLVSVARNVSDKTYLRGLSDVLRFLDPNQGSFVQRFAGGHVPAAIGSTNAAWDDSMRAPATVLEAIKARIPGLDDEVSPKRDLFGAPVNPPAGWVPFFDTQDRGPLANTARTLSPIATSTSATDNAKLELARLNYPFARPSPGIGGLDLRTFRSSTGQTAYDRLLELGGEVTLKMGGFSMALPDAMNRLVDSSEYQRLPVPDGLNDAENPRVMRVKQVLSRYYEAAQIKMLREFPDIQKMTKDALKTERTGNPYGSDLLEHLQKSNY